MMYSIENKTLAKFRECLDECNKHKRRSQKMSNDMMIWHWHVWHIFLLILYSFIGIKIAPAPHVMSGAGSSNSNRHFIISPSRIITISPLSKYLFSIFIQNDIITSESE